MSVEGFLAFGGMDAPARTVRQDIPALLVILQVGDHDLIQHLLMHGWIEDRTKRFDPPLEVTLHEIGGGDVEVGIRVREAFSIAERINARMLQEAPYDRFHPYVVRQPRDSRTQAAYPPDDHIDLHARGACVVKCIYDLR